MNPRQRRKLEQLKWEEQRSAYLVGVLQRRSLILEERIELDKYLGEEVACAVCDLAEALAPGRRGRVVG